ncbi:hypothetical protein BC941DRAFT_442649 [Chlamydoabsidia padenii]|nr:hypothetical protein BC941DRAFT_442649 [Chlamydoabsidia padenii]
MISSRYSEDSHSDLDSLSSDNSSQQLKSPTTRHDYHSRLTATSRRQSRLLYAEKYGLTSPDWHTSSTTDGKDSGNSSCADDDDDQDNDNDNNKKDDHYQDNVPLSLQRRSYSLSTTTLCGRPRSLFNLSQPTTHTLRPAAFVKPTTATCFGTPPSTVPSDMIHIQQLYEQYHKKVYMEGFVFKRNQFNSDGSPCQDDHWTKLYMELSGPILSLWDGEKLVKENNGTTTTGTILPHYINISDATANLVNDNNNPDYFMVILNTAGRNQYLIRPQLPTYAQHWVTAIRLSCFECARLFEIYTRYLLLRPTYLPLWQSTQTTTKRHCTQGYIQARFAGDTEWKKYWAVVFNQRQEKRLFGKTKSVPCRGQMMFYESKKSKHPSVTLINIDYAYTLYPQSPQLIDLATIFKVEGTTLITTDAKTGVQDLTHTSSGTLLMTSTTNEMMQWLVGIFYVFKLYGQPSCLLDDPLDPKSLNFGETAAIHDDDDDDDDSDRLFLETTDVMHLPLGQVETLMDSKLTFTNVLVQKLKNKSIGAPHDGGALAASTRPPLYSVKPRANSAPLLADIPSSPLVVDQSVIPLTNSPTLLSTCSSMVSTTTTHSLQNQPGKPRTLVYASDNSDDDDEQDNNESDSEQSDDVDSIFINTTTPQLTAIRTEKELLTPSEPSTPSPGTSLHHPTDSNKIILPSVDNEYQDNNNNSGDMLGFAKSLLSRTFGMDLAPTNTGSQQQQSPSPSSSFTQSNNNNSTFASIISPFNDSHKETPPSKRFSTRPLSSDGEESDDDEEGSKTDDDDEPIHTSAFNKMKISTSPRRPLSTIMSTTTSTATSSPNTPGSNRFSSYDTTTNNSSITTTNSKGQQHCPPHAAKMKRHSVLSSPQPQPTRSTSTPTRQQPGLVHKIDYMQQQQWETGSVMETDPRFTSYRPQQQMDPRMAMYRHHNGSVYGGSVCGTSVYGDGASTYGNDYQRMMAAPLVQMENKPLEPRAGLIGMIAQLEDEKREKEKIRFSTTQQQQMYQNQLLYQQQLLQQQMMMNNPYMMNPMMMNPMMMNPMMMNPMMMNPMMMMMQQQQQQQWPLMNNGTPLMEDEDEDDTPLCLNKHQDDDRPLGQRQTVGGV